MIDNKTLERLAAAASDTSPHFFVQTRLYPKQVLSLVRELKELRNGAIFCECGLRCFKSCRICDNDE